MLMMLELLSSGPETVVLNADAVYVTTYSVLQLTLLLHRSAYFATAEKSLPMSEVLFNPFILTVTGQRLNNVVLLYTCCTATLISHNFCTYF